MNVCGRIVFFHLLKPMILFVENVYETSQDLFAQAYPDNPPVTGELDETVLEHVVAQMPARKSHGSLAVKFGGHKTSVAGLNNQQQHALQALGQLFNMNMGGNMTHDGASRRRKPVNIRMLKGETADNEATTLASSPKERFLACIYYICSNLISTKLIPFFPQKILSEDCSHFSKPNSTQFCLPVQGLAIADNANHRESGGA